MQHSHTISCFATEECHALPVASVSAVLGSYALYLLLGYIVKVLAKLAHTNKQTNKQTVSSINMICVRDVMIRGNMATPH